MDQTPTRSFFNKAQSPDIDVEDQCTETFSEVKERRSIFKVTKTQIVLNALNLCLFGVVVMFVQATFVGERKSDRNARLGSFLKTNVSTTLTIVRASQGVLSALTSVALQDSFSFIQWNRMNSAHGLPYLTFLAMSPTTGTCGILSLMSSKFANTITRFWALLRMALTGILWASGLVLFFNTSLVTINDTALTYNVTAGVGAFNGSLVRSFINYTQSLSPDYPYQVLPYSYFAAAYTLVANPLLSVVTEPVGCHGSNCISYLLTGGLEMVTPWAPKSLNEYPMVKVSNTPSLQFEFSDGASDLFNDADCDIFGEVGLIIGIRVCVTEDTSNAGSLRAGLFVCPNGIEGDICRSPRNAPNVSTLVSFYTRQTTFVAARSNYSIVGISKTTLPVKLERVDIPEYREALRWLLNYTAAAIPGPSSIAEGFWSSQDQLRDSSSNGMLLQNFQSILAFPFWLFNPNNWGNKDLQLKDMITTLPPEFYTEASIVAPYTKLKFDWNMFLIYIILQAISLLFIWGTLLWVMNSSTSTPQVSSFPLFDVTSKAEVNSQASHQDWQNITNSHIVSTMSVANIFTKRNWGSNSDEGTSGNLGAESMAI